MDVLPLQPHVRAADIPLERLAGNSHISDKDKVSETCRQFEAVLLRQIFAEARKTVIPSGMGQDDAVSGIYGDMVNNQLADSVSRSGTFGLARSLQNQLVRQVLPDAGGGTTPTQVKPSDP